MNKIDNRKLRTFAWSVRREIWENHSLYLAPLIVAGVILLGMLMSLGHFPQLRRNALLLDETHRRAAIHLPYNIAASMILLTVFIVGFFYCLDALYGERRDRSILFWKSLPVSDLTTVLSKMCVPLVVLPVISLGTIALTHFLILILTSMALIGSGLITTTFANYNLFTQTLMLVYSLIAIALWHAPIYGWALLVSVWARRATFLCAVLPWLALGMFEKIAFGTSHVGSFIEDRLIGFASRAFDVAGEESAFHSFAQLTPGNFLTSPALWLGLVAAAGFLAVAVRLRRYRGAL